MRSEIYKIINSITSYQVNLSDMKIRDDEVEEIINHIIKQNKPDISMIVLDNNNIGDQGAIILGDKLHYFQNIQVISIQFNNISEKGAFSLFALKKVFPKLDILFHGNQITSVNEMAEIEQAALAMPSKPGLR